MNIPSDYKIFSGLNYRLLTIPGFDSAVFGCPPGLVKDFARINMELPRQFVMPIRTFVQGRNLFDFEFVVYSFLFMRSKKEKIEFYCTPDQKDRFSVILNETLYGPRFDQILCSQFRRLMDKHAFKPKEREELEKYLTGLAGNAEMFSLYQKMKCEHLPEERILKAVKERLAAVFARERWLKQRKNPAFILQAAKNYQLCAQIKSEMDIFALAPEDKRQELTQRVITFNLFDQNNMVYLNGNGANRERIKVEQFKPSVFKIYDREEYKCTIDLSQPATESNPIKITPMRKPFMGVTFLGVGSGFAPARNNSCVIVWSEEKGIMVDALHDGSSQALAHGISEGDIKYVFLTHVHSDHDTGLIEKILYGSRVKIISTRIIFESFLRKVEALTCFPVEMIESFVDFVEVEPNKRVKLHGFAHTYFTFDYTLHSIPTGRFRLTYKPPRGKEFTISHSGDTKYDVEKINKWYDEGKLTSKRRDALLGFIWDAELIVHEVGGGVLHTEYKSLLALDKKLIKKTILVHQHDDPVPKSPFRFANEGETAELIKARTKARYSPVQTLLEVPLFRGVKPRKLMQIFSRSEVVHYKPGETVVTQNEIGDCFYVILDGFVETVIDGKTIAVYEKGKFFGELAITTDNPLRRATVRALSHLTLLKIHRKFYKQFGLPKIQDDFYKLRSFYSDIVSPGLIASLAFGKIGSWKQGETIIKRGSHDRDMYVILSGQVRVVGGNGQTLAMLSGGDVFGELALLKKVARTASVIADSGEVYAIVLERSQAYKVFKLFPTFFGTVYQKAKRLETNLK